MPERHTPHLEQPGRIDPSLETSIFLVLDYLHDAKIGKVSGDLYAFDPNNPHAFDRQQGTGRLRLSEGGDLQINLILEGQQGESWKLVTELQRKKVSLKLDEASLARLSKHRIQREKWKDDARRYVPPTKEAKHAEAPPSSDFPYNESEARRLGLEKLEVKAYPEAQRLIQEVITKKIDISTPQDQERFVRAWVHANPDLPPPCVPNETLWKELFHGKPYPSNIDKKQGNFWYLIQLQSGKIISNLAGDPLPVSPHYEREEILLVDTWKETDYNAPDATQKHTSPLLKELLGNASTVKMKREDLDNALWQGDPSLRIPTAKHKQLLQQLGVPPDHFELRCIRQDEYARLAPAESLGQHQLWTNFEHYFLGGGGGRGGLNGGAREFGGASSVGFYWRGSAGGNLSVRLVLSAKGG